MRLSRTHLVPVLAIVAGGVIGASLSFSFLELRSDDVVVVAAPVSATYENVEVLRLEEAQRLLEQHPEAPVESVRYQMDEAQRVLDRVQEVQLRREEVLLQRDIEEGLRELEFGLREELQERALTCFFNGAVYRFRSVDGDPEWVELSSDEQRIAQSGNQPLVCIDSVDEEAATRYLLQLGSLGPRIVDNFVAEDIEDVEVQLSVPAVRRFGEEASNGAIVITLKEDRLGR